MGCNGVNNMAQQLKDASVTILGEGGTGEAQSIQLQKGTTAQDILDSLNLKGNWTVYLPRVKKRLKPQDDLYALADPSGVEAVQISLSSEVGQ